MTAPQARPWLEVAWQQPATVAEHMGAWAALFASEGPAVVRLWRRQLLWRLVAWSCLGLGLGLAGVATLLWAVATPATPAPAGLALALFGVPALPLLAALGCWWGAARLHDGGARQRLTAQWQAERVLWRAGGHGDGDGA
jgi:hypothetical protein